MPFMGILKTLVDSTPVAVGAIIVDWEGEAVQEFCHCDQFEIRFLGAHLEIILDRFRAATSADCGNMKELVLTTAENYLIIGCIDEKYSLVMNVGRNCALALALNNFRKALVELEKEI